MSPSATCDQDPGTSTEALVTSARKEEPVPVASDYPFLDIVWTMFIFFAWIIWFVLLFRVIADIFRRKDISGWGRTLWLIFVIILPFLGVFIYLIAHGNDMAERDARIAQAQQQQIDSHIQSVAGSGGAATEIGKAKQLLDGGTITQAEFDAIKTKALA
jgi:phospholipase D-like protein